MKYKYLYRALGFAAFLIAFITFYLTVQPSVPFWDCGEFSAASVWQQVPHPPGAPLFLMIGKIFHLIIPFGDFGWRINLVSVLSSAFVIWLLYLISVKVIMNLRSEPFKNLAEELATYGSAFIGSLALIYSDTFWFNAVESEVYAMSALFVALITYLMMKWNEEADKPGHERYLLLIAYLIGLSTGVHLLAILTIFSLALIVYFRKYQFHIKSFSITVVLSVVVFGIIYPGIVKWLPAMLDGSLLFKNDCKEHIVQNVPAVTFLAILMIVAAIFLFWWSIKKDFPILKLITSSFLLLLIGYSTYTQILLRSNANSPMNENEPKNLHSLTSYLGREQYGDAPNWPRRYQTDDYYTRNYNKKDENGKYVYGEWIPPARVDTRCKDESKVYSMPKFLKTNFSGEINYLFKYQIYHMYIRYFLWNYMGRTSDIQDSPEAFDGQAIADRINYKMGYADIYPIRFYALPLLFGLLGLFFHFWKDPKMAFAYLVMFLFMGVLAAIAQNQQEPQPRERDYFYTGSFFVWSMWIGIGVYFLIDWIGKQRYKVSQVIAILLIALLLVPVNMAAGGWKMHDRSGNYIPFDYSYNILQSCDKDAIVFTNGDNDTFPVWFLQDVEGVRRDVRVVNLSLGNTLWYIDQLKNREPWGAKKIPLSFSNESLQVDEGDDRALAYDFGEAQEITIPVPKDVMRKYTNDPRIIESGKMTFTFTGKPYTKKANKQIYLIRVQDKLILDILRQVKWQRPVYFSSTVGQDAFSGLQPYFRNEGMVMRICPVKQRSSYADAIDESIMTKTLLNVDNSNNFHKEQHYGFKLRNLNNMSVFYDQVHRRLMTNYRSLYTNFAAYYMQNNRDVSKAGAILDTLNKYISITQFPLPYEIEYRMARIYGASGDSLKAHEFLDMTLKSCKKIISSQDIRQDSKYYELTGRSYGPFRIASDVYRQLGDYDSAREMLQQLSGQMRQVVESMRNNPAYQENVQKVSYAMYDLQTNIDELSIDELKDKGKIKEAYDKALEIANKYANSPDPNLKFMKRYIDEKVNELAKELGIDKKAEN